MFCVAVVEARMGSTRFPGKVLAPLAGMPLLQHIGLRLNACAVLEKVVLATSTLPPDDILAERAPALGFEVIRGPEDDLLARHLLVLERYAPDIMVRITGDCPLVDPDVLIRLVKLLESSGADYATVRPGTPCIHEGIDPFRGALLRRLSRACDKNPVVKEHVVTWLKKHPGFANIAYLALPQREQLAGVRISVDTPADLAFLEQIYSRLGVPAGHADIREVADLLRTHPELLRMNSHVVQKAAGAHATRVVIRCFSHAYGPTLALLAGVLRDIHGFGIRFSLDDPAVEHPDFSPFAYVENPMDFQPDIILDAGQQGDSTDTPSMLLTLANGHMHILPGHDMYFSPIAVITDDTGIRKAADTLSHLCRFTGQPQRN